MSPIGWSSRSCGAGGACSSGTRASLWLSGWMTPSWQSGKLVVDRREIVEACFVHPGVLREMRDRDKVGEYVQRHAGARSGSNATES